MQVEDVDGVPTHVFSLKNKARNNALLLVIPGSPGMSHFYVPFATRLFQLGDGAYDVAVVSHAGHSPGFARSVEHDTDGRDWYSLENQIVHKVAYIRDQASDKEALYLVGHSIGCYMILQMLKKLSSDRVKKGIFLFPTIERISQTPNGRRLYPLFTTLRFPFSSVIGLLSWLPNSVKQFILRRYFYTTPADHVEHITQAVINIDGKGMHNILCMAHQEVEEVSELPLEIIHEHIDKLVFYYGVGDKWTLGNFYEEMVNRFPDKDINLCTGGHPHAFVLTASHEMADFVYSRLQREQN